MLEARSVAVVGASVKEGSLGRQMMLELARGGYEGEVYPVNPGYRDVLGHHCFPSIGDVPEPVDLAILGIANARIEAAMDEAVAAGAGSIVTFSSLHEEEPPAPGLSPLTDRVARIANSAGMPLCGGNGMGFLQLESKLRATGFPTPDAMRPGPVALISHSGSAFAAFAFNDRGIGFNLIVSSGQEIVTTMADYVDYAVSLPSTRVLALLLETVRDPEGLRRGLTLAAERDIGVLALKMGRTEGSKAMVTAHSGALAGEHGAYEALFDAHGVHECRTLDEMADAIELFSSPRRVRSGSGIASVHDSGGERALLVDLADELGVPLAGISPATTARIEAVLDPGLVAENPLDAWGTGIDAEQIFRTSMRALHDDADTAALAFAVDMTRQAEPPDAGYLGIALETWADTHKPFCMLSNLSSAVAHEQASFLREAGIPVLEGTDQGLRSLAHLLAEREHRERPPVRDLAPVDPEMRDRWRGLIARSSALSEVDALRLLRDYGVPVVEAEPASSLDEAVAAADRIGYPVAVKTATAGVEHKSDAGGIHLGIADGAELAMVYGDLLDRLGPTVSVASMAPPGLEIALGIVNDVTFGPLMLVAAGGTLVEVLNDRRLAFPPLDEVAAHRLIDRLRVRPLLDGVRGMPAADIDRLAEAIARLSVLAQDVGDLIEALDVNPVICSPTGCVAVDALIVPLSEG
jgi:acetate---CoA ligase (ADP-forming)